MEWIRRPLTCDGVVVAESLDPNNLSDVDLKSICLRMHAIFHTIEMPRAEERWMPVELFDEIDTLEGLVLHNDSGRLTLPNSPRLTDWEKVITEFGVHYDLVGHGAISIDPGIYRDIAVRYGV
ncbi:MAG: hypothetical protein Q8K78_11795 [Planctomycetaceae bacterium]|nr:hypothetical protein [Planctomycetaceae bacterium]